MSDCLDYYKILGVSSDAKFEDIKHKYRDLAKIWHPDYNKSNNANDMFQKISIAYGVLEDDKNRLIYDIFSIAYKTPPAPDMFSLKIYKSQNKQENNDLRVLNIFALKGLKTKKDKTICSFIEAKKIVLKTTIQNWTTGIINPQFILAIKNNLFNLFNKDDNLQLLLHNSLAYFQDKNNTQAAIYATRALSYASATEHIIIKKWLTFLGFNTPSIKTVWNYEKLKQIQLIPLGMAFLLAFLLIAPQFVSKEELLKFFGTQKEIAYFQRVKFNNGGETFNDSIVAKVLNYPVNIDDDSKLYHLKNKAEIKHGPSTDFDTLTILAANTTVRITGATPDMIWLRVMIDNGEMGFIKKDGLKQGIGKAIPEQSSVK